MTDIDDVKEQFVYDEGQEDKGPCTQQEMSDRAYELNEFKDMSFEEKEEKSLKIIEEALDKDIKNPVISSSFGKDSTALIHLVHRVDDSVPVVMNDTGLMFPETKKYMRRIRDKWDLDVDVVKPDMTFWEVADEYGFPSPKGRNTIQGDNTEPKCCKILKTDPMRRYIKENDIDLDFVGVTGDEGEGRQRRLMYVMRGTFTYFHKTWEIWKSVPLLFWHKDDVWEYFDKYDLEKNPAYEKYNQERTGCVACFDGDTTVYGMNKNRKIKDIGLSDEVLTSTGYTSPVDKFVSDYTGDMVKLNVQGIEPIKMTADHNVLTAKKDIDVNYKKTGEYYDDGRKKYKKTRNRKFKDIGWKEAIDIDEDDYVLIKRKKEFLNDDIDKKLAWLAGLYVAEGFVSEQHGRDSDYVEFTLGSHEKELIRKCNKILKKKFDTHTKPYRKRNVMRIKGYKNAPNYFESFGRKGEEKKVPYFMKNANPKTQKAFIKGWFDGDGNKEKDRETMRISTSTKKLKDDLVEMLTTTFGIMPYVNKRENQTSVIEGRMVNAKPNYSIRWPISEWNSKKTTYTTYHSDKDFLYVPVKSIDKEYVENKKVYNLQTDAGDYSLPFSVKNCTAHPRFKKAISKYSPDLLKLILERMDNQTTLDDFVD